MKNIKQIIFPNNVSGEDTMSYEVGKNGITEIRTIYKNGEMASINWFQIIKDDNVIAEIKESVCNIYGEDKKTEINNIAF